MSFRPVVYVSTSFSDIDFYLLKSKIFNRHGFWFCSSCFTTEILEGFDLQRTSGITETVKRYGFLTQSIIHLYTMQFPFTQHDSANICPTFEEFIKRCQDHEKLQITDVFSLQLMQVSSSNEYLEFPLFINLLILLLLMH